MRSWLRRLAAGVAFAATGIAFAIYVVGPRVLNPFDVSWLKGDPATGYLGWAFFRLEDHLSLPLGWTSSLGYPLGEPIAYLDAMPLVAAVLWPFRQILPTAFQYLGAWFALCVILQFYFGYRISRRLTGGHRLTGILGGLLFMMAPPFIWRASEHFALTSHWLILAAFDFYFAAGKRISRGQAAAAILLCFIAGGINPYITAMVLLVLAAAYLRWVIAAENEADRNTASRVAFAAIGIGFSIMAAVAAFLLFGFLRPGDAGYAGAGYKIYSMNLLAPFDPLLFPGLLWDALPVLSSEQSEGYNYLGLGVIVLGLAALAFQPLILKPLFQRDAIPGWLIFAVALLLALSLKASAGSIVLYDLAVPDSALNALRAFRASGRLFWPAFYLILCCVIAASYAAFGGKARTALLLALLVQFFDLRTMHIGIREGWSAASAAAFTDGQDWQAAVRSHRHLVVVPPWQCGPGSPGGFPGYWTFGKLAARHGMTINSFYAGRNSPKQLAYFCGAQLADIESNGFRADTAYVYNSLKSIGATNTRDHFCRSLDGVVLCSLVSGKKGIGPGIADDIAALPADGVLSFRAADDSARPFLGDGWSTSEPWGRWTDGATASLVMRVKDNVRGAELTFSLKPFVPPGRVSRVELTANGRNIANWSFDAGGERDIAVHLPADAIGAGGVVTLRFHLPDADYPQEFGLPRDDRKLALGLTGLRVTQKDN